MSEPQLGDILGGSKLGYKDKSLYMWSACRDCGQKRWLVIRKIPQDRRCRSCQNKGRIGEWGAENANWKGGRYLLKTGYIRLRIYPGDFYYPMANLQKDGTGTILEHRLVMAKSLGRNLHTWEIVHHKNGIKDDNRIENLQLVTDDRHNQITLLENRIKVLERRVTLLEAENVLLGGEEWQTSRQRSI